MGFAVSGRARRDPPGASVCVSVPAAAASFAFAFDPRGALPGLPLGLASPPERHSLSAASNSRRFASSSNSPSNNDGVSFTTRAPPVVRRSARAPDAPIVEAPPFADDDDGCDLIEPMGDPIVPVGSEATTNVLTTTTTDVFADDDDDDVEMLYVAPEWEHDRRGDADVLTLGVSSSKCDMTRALIGLAEDGREPGGGAGAGGYPRLGLPSGAPSRMTTCSTRGEAGREPPRGAEPGRRDADADVGRVRRFAWDRRTAEGSGPGWTRRGGPDVEG